MKVSNVKNNYIYNRNFSRVDNTSFKAYVYRPMKHAWPFGNINPLKVQLDKILEKSLKIAQVRVRRISKELEPITKEVLLKNNKGQKFSYAWDINPDNRQKYVLFLHGTGQNITNLQPLYKEVIDKTNYAVLAPEFRGFGINPPANISRKSLLEDAKGALDYLISKGIKKEDICVVGHSLGSRVATDLAVKNKNMKKLVLMSPINSFVKDMDFEKNLQNSVPKYIFLLHKKCPLLSKAIDNFYGIGNVIKKVEAPVDIIHAKKDILVDYHSARNIAAKCKNLRSLSILEEGAHIIDTPKVDTLVKVLNNTI